MMQPFEWAGIALLLPLVDDDELWGKKHGPNSLQLVCKESGDQVKEMGSHKSMYQR